MKARVGSIAKKLPEVGGGAPSAAAPTGQAAQPTGASVPVITQPASSNRPVGTPQQQQPQPQAQVAFPTPSGAPPGPAVPQQVQQIRKGKGL